MMERFVKIDEMLPTEQIAFAIKDSGLFKTEIEGMRLEIQAIDNRSNKWRKVKRSAYTLLNSIAEEIDLAMDDFENSLSLLPHNNDWDEYLSNGHIRLTIARKFASAVRHYVIERQEMVPGY